MAEIANARSSTKAIIASIIRGLRSGKSQKEIAFLIGVSPKYVEMILLRYPEVHSVFRETYFLRHPEKEELPPTWQIVSVGK